MKRHGNIFEKIVTFENLIYASKRASTGKKASRAVASFLFHLENEMINLKLELESGIYRPKPYTQFQIFEPKPRKICSSDFRDRVVHHAVCKFIDPIFEDRAIHDSYACRINKGSHKAVIRCQEFTRRFSFYLKCDIKKYFESIDHTTLKRLLRRVLKDEKILDLLDIIIDHEVPGNSRGCGLPIGNLTSQHFANFYLGELDHYLKDNLGVKGYVRYMDDFISFSDDKRSLVELLHKIQEFVGINLKLELKHKVTTLAPVTEGISFLGFRVFPNVIRIKRENLIRMRKKIRKKESLFLKGLISESELIQSVSSINAHVSHVNSLAIRKEIFIDSLRMA